MEASVGMALLLGLLLGARHAVDADHVVAITTIIGRNRGMLRSALVGLAWGAGHNLTLFGAGFVVLVLKLSIPHTFTLSAEFAVGVLLVILGVPLVWQLMRRKAHAHVHQHDDGSHFHLHSHADTPHHEHAHLRKPLLVGMLHGLAGSGALTLVALNTMPSLGQGLVFLAVFALGITATMIVLSGLIGLPFRLAAQISIRLGQWIQGAAGMGSIALGLLVMWQTGLAGKLFH
ncbi:MAG TPA: urease accessory protein UreH [Dehalococcoidia bacterium]|nr:urease accessory protein UreH [Dehalococcoidia bacterium]